MTHNTPAASDNLHFFSSPTRRMIDTASTFAEPSSVKGNTTAEAPSLILPPVETQLVSKLDQDEQSNNEEPVKVDIDADSIIETMSFHDNSSLLGFNVLSAQQDPTPTGTDGDCNTVQNKETDHEGL